MSRIRAPGQGIPIFDCKPVRWLHKIFRVESDVFFITYDEPLRDEYWTEFHSLVPDARRVDEIKGFNAAYRKCAELARTNRFFTVDGDNRIDPAFLRLRAELTHLPDRFPDAVLSWSALNPVNGLRYGNGSVKSWPRHVALAMETHEASSGFVGKLDFCHSLQYVQMPETLSVTHIHSTPFQAFRAGFREGVKLSLDRGTPLSKVLLTRLDPDNLSRLRIWCSVGSDVKHGDWAIYGARLGCERACLLEWDSRFTADYEWIAAIWKERCEPFLAGNGEALAELIAEIDRLGERLNSRLSLGVVRLNPVESAFFKSVYLNPVRRGPIPLPVESLA